MLSLYILIDVMLYLFAYKRLGGCNTFLVEPFNPRPAVISILLIIIFSFWAGDYQHMWDGFNDLLHGDSGGNVEVVYLTMAKLTQNYLLFRLAFWGGGFGLLCVSAKRFGLNQRCFIAMFLALTLVTYSYARVSLSMALMFFGTSIIVVKGNSNRLVELVLGALLIYASFFMHKSAAYGIAMIVLSILLALIKKEKFFIISLIISFPLLLGIAHYFLDSFMEMSFSVDDSINYMAGQKYLNQEDRNLGAGALMENIFQWGFLYTSAILYLKTIIKGEFNQFPFSIKVFANATFLIILGASTFLFSSGYSTFVLFYRFINFAVIPVAFFLTYCFQNCISPKLSKIIFYLGTANALYAMIYAAYCNF